MATAPVYCTHKELKRVYPNIDAYDTKTPIYGWVSSLTDFYDASMDILFSTDTGLITDLFIDGAKIDKIAYNTTETTKLDGAVLPDASSFIVDDGTGFGANDIVKIDNEYMRVVSVSVGDNDTITVSRGQFGTKSDKHTNGALIKLINVPKILTHVNRPLLKESGANVQINRWVEDIFARSVNSKIDANIGVYIFN